MARAQRSNAAPWFPGIAVLPSQNCSDGSAADNPNGTRRNRGKETGFIAVYIPWQ
jgi:hypothetical protein